MTDSEQLFQRFCEKYGIPCERIPTGGLRTPDFCIRVGDQLLVVEVKEINLNDDDRRDISELEDGVATGRLVPNRVRKKLKDTSQLKAAARDRYPTLLVLYDNTPFKLYDDHFDVVTAMLGEHSVTVTSNEEGSVTVSEPGFGGNSTVRPDRNVHVSAVAILEGGPIEAVSLRLYHNPYASVPLSAELFDGLPVTHALPVGATSIVL